MEAKGAAIVIHFYYIIVSEDVRRSEAEKVLNYPFLVPQSVALTFLTDEVVDDHRVLSDALTLVRCGVTEGVLQNAAAHRDTVVTDVGRASRACNTDGVP